MRIRSRPGKVFFSVLLIAFSLLTPEVGLNADAPMTFSTWEGFEPDKCASIWLIKRFIDKNAVIKFYPKGEILDEGIPFDTPNARFRRYHNMSTFESIVKHYNLLDPKVAYLGKIMHDIEVNMWERKVLTETLSVQDAINEIIESSSNSDEIINNANAFFDNLYEEINPGGHSLEKHQQTK